MPRIALATVEEAAVVTRRSAIRRLAQWVTRNLPGR